MVAPADYHASRLDGWRLWALDGVWDSQLQNQVLSSVRALTPTRHPQTIQVRAGLAGGEKRYFLKVFHRMSWMAALKDQLRQSRALGSWRQGMALAAAGFLTPVVVAVGVERGWRKVRREFLLTETIAGAPLPLFLRRDDGATAASTRFKRDSLVRFAQLIRRFHDAGFVHGDLVASNILVATDGAPAVDFYFIDNDRTHRYPGWLRQTLWKRNLLQLNRMPLARISLQDRMRFMRAYLRTGRLSAADRKFARWLEARTRQRRMECDGADPTGSFRRLMRWVPNPTGLNGAELAGRRLKRG